MSEKITKGQKVVFDSVCKNKGDSTAAITWRHLGGGFTEGTAVGVITITPAQLVFALGLKARASELVKMGRLERKGKALGCVAGTSGDGHWPTGDYGRYRAKPPRPAAPSEPVRVVTGVAMASKISDLSSELDD